MERLTITSPSFPRDGYLPAEYTCDGRDRNPALIVENVPEAARSLAIIMDDPDAPGGTWTHWLLWDMDPRSGRVPENGIPRECSEGMNDFGRLGYGGPCPPSGMHHYHFRIYALDTKLALKPRATRPMLEAAMSGHIIDQAELVGRYSRK